MRLDLPPERRRGRKLNQPLARVSFQNRASVFLICIFLGAITFAVFGSTSGHEFVNYDDQNYVYENPKITGGLTIAGLAWAFTHVHAQNWHPLTTISHMLDCQLYGLNAGGHHLTNILLHIIAVILLFLVLRQMTGALWRSAFVAAVFAIHPLRVESVAWVAERKDVLSGVFFLLTLGAYLRYVRAPSIGRYVAVAFVFLLGLMSKPMLVTVPIILLILDYWPLNRWRRLSPTPSKPAPDWPLRTSIPRNLVIEKIPLVALSVLSSVITVLAQKHAIGWIEQLPLGWRLTNAAVSYVAYVWQMIWPVNLAAFYPHPENRLPLWEIILAVAALVAVTAAALARRKSHPYMITGWLWYIIMLVPVIGLMQVGWQGRADRYTYLPQIGLIVLVTWAVADLSAGWRRQRELLAIPAALVIVVLSYISWKQTFYWHDSERLWTHTLAVTSNNDVAQTNLGIVLLGQGKTDAAIARFKQAVELRPQNGPAHENLAKTFLQQGRIDEAMAHYRTVLEIQPENSEARNILGMLLFQRGRIKDAVGQWQQTLRTEPENGNAKNNLAWVFATYPKQSIRDGVKAVQLAEEAAQLSGGSNPMILRTLAAAYAESGRFPEAIETAQRGAELAIRQGNSALADELQSNITLYRTNSALRDARAVDANE